MSKQKSRKKPPVREKEDTKSKDKPVDGEKAKKLKEDMDKLMDEIDDILEKDSEDFVKSYVQKGGE